MYVLLIYALLGIFSFLYLFMNIKNKEKISVFIFTVIALFFLFRFNVGQDIRTYLLNYERVTNPIKDTFTYNANRNFGFTLLIYICKCFSLSYPWFIFVTNFIALASITYITFKYSKNVLLSLLMFVGSGYLEVYYGSGLRQSIAMSIFLFIFYEFLPKKQYGKYYIGAIIACLFHEAAVVTLFIPVIHKHLDWIRKHWKQVSIISLVSAALISFVVSYVAPKIAYAIGFNDAITHLALYFMTQSFSVLGLGLEVVLASLCILLYVLNDDKSDWKFFEVSIIFFSLLVYVLMIRYPLVSRVCDLIQAITLVLIPNFIQSISNKKRQILSISIVFLLNGFLLYSDLKQKLKNTGYTFENYPYITIVEQDKIDNFLYDE